MTSPNDVMSDRAQQRHRFKVEPLPSSNSVAHEQLYQPRGQRERDVYEERLQDSRTSNPADLAGFKLDFRAWRAGQCDRDRRIIDDLARDERTTDLAAKYGVSPGAISQRRRRYEQEWNVFVGDVPAPVQQ